MEMEEVCSPETSTHFYQSTFCYMAEVIHRSENLSLKRLKALFLTSLQGLEETTSQYGRR
jgi:hypothetical protein